jgi:type IV pilus modification protein PilV
MMAWDGRKGGFSLLEAVLAVLILGIGITGMAEGITAALRTSKEAEYRTAAALLASGALEEIRAEGFLTEGEKDMDAEECPPPYSIHEVVARTPTDGLYEVTITVQLASTKETIHEVKTLLFDPETSSTFAARSEGAGTLPERRARR